MGERKLYSKELKEKAVRLTEKKQKQNPISLSIQAFIKAF